MVQFVVVMRACQRRTDRAAYELLVPKFERVCGILEADSFGVRGFGEPDPDEPGQGLANRRICCPEWARRSRTVRSHSPRAEFHVSCPVAVD